MTFPSGDTLEALLGLEQRATIETVLIVDDSERDRYLIKGILSALGAVRDYRSRVR